MNASVQAKLRAALEQNSDAPAAYLFGSAAADEPVHNDVEFDFFFAGVERTKYRQRACSYKCD
jgi:hypothetical protein